MTIKNLLAPLLAATMAMLSTTSMVPTISMLSTASMVSMMALAPEGVRAQAAASAAPAIDQRSLELGAIGAFAEMVDVGVKKLAFSGVMSTAEVNALWEEASRAANEHHVALYREPDLLISDLFPADVAKGKVVLLIYKGSTLDEYMALKRRKALLVQSGTYTGKAREEIARQLGRLLSYPESGIDALLKKNTVRE
jgi:hypothetical protein